MFHLARLQIADGYHAGDPLDQGRRGGHRQLDSPCGSRPFIFDFNFDRDGFTGMEHLIAILVTDDRPEYHRGRLVHWNRHRNGYRRLRWSRLGATGLACLSGIDNLVGRPELLGHTIRHITHGLLGNLIETLHLTRSLGDIDLSTTNALNLLAVEDRPIGSR